MPPCLGDWLEHLSAATNLAVACSLLGEDASVLAIVQEAKNGISTPTLLRVELATMTEVRPFDESRARAMEAMGSVAEDGLITIAKTASTARRLAFKLAAKAGDPLMMRL